MKQNNHHHFRNTLCFLTLLAFCLIFPAKVQAATQSKVVINGADIVKAGKYYFQYTSDDSKYLFKAAKTKNELKKNSSTFASFSFSTVLPPEFVTDGTWVFYSISKGNNHSIYKIKVNGKNKTKITTIKSKGIIELIGYSNKKLSYTIGTDKGTSLYLLSTVNKKKNLLIKNANEHINYTDINCPYIIFSKNYKNKVVYSVYNKVSGKVTKTETINDLNYYDSLTVVTDKYLAVFISEESYINVLRMALKGSGGFINITTFLDTTMYAYSNKSGDVFYIKEDSKTGKKTYYRYNVDKNKSTKTSEKAYNKLFSSIPE